jgi:hypothetical protein
MNSWPMNCFEKYNPIGYWLKIKIMEDGRL